jgi:hypothetical protein
MHEDESNRKRIHCQEEKGLVELKKGLLGLQMVPSSLLIMEA